MNLAVDIGNSQAKAAIFEEEGGEWRIRRVAPEDIPERIERAIVVSTRGGETQLEREVRARAGFHMKFDHDTPVPIRNLYATPETLGPDRLAAAVGARTLHPGRTMLVVDLGTAITFDVVTAGGEYLGGNISPGAVSRFRALHDHTVALPLFGPGDLPSPDIGEGFPARNTRSAMVEGVAQGIVAETEYYIARTKTRWSDAGVIFTGGDAEYFAGRVNFPIFAVSDLVFWGLNAILEYNAKI